MVGSTLLGNPRNDIEALVGSKLGVGGNEDALGF